MSGRHPSGPQPTNPGPVESRSPSLLLRLPSQAGRLSRSGQKQQHTGRTGSLLSKAGNKFYRYHTNSSSSMAKSLFASWCCSSSCSRFLNVLRSEPSLFCHYNKCNWAFATQAREGLLPSNCDLASWASKSSKSLMTQRSLQLKKWEKEEEKKVRSSSRTSMYKMWRDVMGCDAFVRSWHNLQICCMYKGIATKADLCSKSCVRNKRKSNEEKTGKALGKEEESSPEWGVKTPNLGGRGPGVPDSHLVNTRNSRVTRAWVQATEPISLF